MKNKLLIVDDDEVMVLLLKKLFEKKFIVYTASDGVEALCYLSRGINPDLIISDLLMENISGYEFIQHLTTSVLFKNIPVIVVSSIPTEEFSHKFPHIEKLDKPFDPLELKNLVDSTMKLQETQITCNN